MRGYIPNNVVLFLKNLRLFIVEVLYVIMLYNSLYYTKHTCYSGFVLRAVLSETRVAGQSGLTSDYVFLQYLQ
jgi:hypothetical protein